MPASQHIMEMMSLKTKRDGRRQRTLLSNITKETKNYLLSNNKNNNNTNFLFFNLATSNEKHPLRCQCKLLGCLGVFVI